MRTIELTFPDNLQIRHIPETAAAIGFFDGVHIGHQQVIQYAVDHAGKHNLESAVITFHPHPSEVLNPQGVKAEYITPIEQKKRFLESMHIDRLYIITFNKELSKMSPQAFVDHFIIGLHVTHLVAGFDFTYGHKGKGNMEVLGEQSRRKFTHTTVNEITLYDEKVSSTNIRAYLRDGSIQKANTLLGRPFTVTGLVVHGQKRGRKLGYPTANLELEAGTMLPKPGVYAVRVHYEGDTYNAMANIGTNPTFTPDEKQLSAEVHLFDFQEEIYGASIMIEWCQYIRPEMTFSSGDELVDKMKEDEQDIRAYFASLV